PRTGLHPYGTVEQRIPHAGACLLSPAWLRRGAQALRESLVAGQPVLPATRLAPFWAKIFLSVSFFGAILRWCAAADSRRAARCAAGLCTPAALPSTNPHPRKRCPICT